jgi:flavin-dependent dehydrogenase
MAAALLARSGARVRVLERDQFPRQKLCGDTLNPGALRILSAHFALDQLLHASLPLDGMVLTGPGGVSVRGEYGERRVGRAIRRQDFDAWLIEQARTAGACVEYGVTVRDTLRTCHGVVCGVTAGERASSREYRARIVIAADGRASRLARASGLAQHPRRPRRWAIGGYFRVWARAAKCTCAADITSASRPCLAARPIRVWSSRTTVAAVRGRTLPRCCGRR